MCSIEFNLHSSPAGVGTIIMPILQMKRLKYRALQSLVFGCNGGAWLVETILFQGPPTSASSQSFLWEPKGIFHSSDVPCQRGLCRRSGGGEALGS